MQNLTQLWPGTFSECSPLSAKLLRRIDFYDPVARILTLDWLCPPWSARGKLHCISSCGKFLSAAHCLIGCQCLWFKLIAFKRGVRNGEGYKRESKWEKESEREASTQHSKPFEAFKKIILFQFLKVSYTRFEVEFIINRALRLSAQGNLFKGSLFYLLCILTSTLSSTHLKEDAKWYFTDYIFCEQYYSLFCIRSQVHFNSSCI